MLKNSIKKVIISAIALFLVVSTAYVTFASEGGSSILDEINAMLQNQNGTINVNENTEEIPEGTNNNVTGNQGLNTNTSENLPESTPHAGLGDYSGLIFVVIFAFSAIYAYKKVKEYNA